MAAYINTNTLEYPVFEGDIRLAFPNTSFPRQFAPPDGYAAVASVPRPNIDHTQNVVEGAPAETSGSWVQTWVVTSASAQQVADRTDAKAKSVRSERNTLLRDCDWTQLADSPVANKAAWVQYRQALRDISSQAGFPWSVVWPVTPA
jgi:hypothetical protein